MEVKIIEVLQPHDAIQSLAFFLYGGNRLPVWIMSSLGNLTRLEMEGLKMVNRISGMEFASLIELRIEDCPLLREVLIATPKLSKLEVSCCRELQAASFLPSLTSDSADLHLIIAQLEDLTCDCHVFECFIQQMEGANSWCNKLEKIILMAGGVGVASLPRGWPTILKSLETLEIRGIDRANFQLLPNGEGSANFPPSLLELYLKEGYHMARLPSDLCNLTSLRHLEIHDFPGLVSFELQEVPPDLQTFSIWRWENLTKLPDGFANFTSLNYVSVYDCPNLGIFQDEMIPPTASFWTSGCDRVVSSHS